MYCGLPVLVHDFPELRRIVEEVGCGTIVDSSSPKSIAWGASFLLQDPKKMAEMGERGKKAIEKKYNYSCELKQLIKLYKWIAEK
jgi:glycosyltransferase involved in cell wall biosynthesis